VVAATNRSLEGLVREGRFREDLFYRVSVIPISIPPLRERPDDILPLARHFLALASRDGGKTIKGLTPAAEQRLLTYGWPGNVRELRNLIERAVILSSGDTIDADELNARPDARVPAPMTPTTGLVPLEEVERSHINAVLARVHGNRSAAARILGITRQTLRKKISASSTNS
jgi:DNA-binding NtrC family response regulator